MGCAWSAVSGGVCVVCRESSAVPSAHSKLACDKLRSLAPLVRWVLGSLTSGVEWCSVRGRWVGCYAIRSRQTHSNQTRLRQTPLTRSARSLGAGVANKWRGVVQRSGAVGRVLCHPLTANSLKPNSLATNSAHSLRSFAGCWVLGAGFYCHEQHPNL